MRSSQADLNAAKLDAIRHLIDVVWPIHMQTYPDTELGNMARAAVTCSAREVRALLDPPCSG